MVVFYHHYKRRASVVLYAEPTGIAPMAALLSRSDFLVRLEPNDTRGQIKRKLKDLRFTLDPDRGIISKPRDPTDGENNGAS